MGTWAEITTQVWGIAVVFAFLAPILVIYWLCLHFFIARIFPIWLRGVHNLTRLFMTLGTIAIFLIQFIAWIVERAGLIRSEDGPDLASVIATTIWVFLFFGLGYLVEKHEIARLESDRPAKK